MPEYEYTKVILPAGVEPTPEEIEQKSREGWELLPTPEEQIIFTTTAGGVLSGDGLKWIFRRLKTKN